MHSNALATPPHSPPGPPCPWWGLPQLRAMARDYLGFFTTLQRQHGDLCFLRLGWERSYDVFHPDDVRRVLVDHADDLIRWERGIEVFAQTMGQSLLTTEGELWRRQRRQLTPGFAPQRVQGYAALMVDAAHQALARALPPDADAAAVDMDGLFTRLTMDVILRTLFSQPAARNGAEDQAVQEVMASVQTLARIGMREMFWPMTLPDWLPLPGKSAKRQALVLLRGHIREHVARRRALPTASAPQDDLLAMLLAARDEQGQGLSEREVLDQCAVMFQAGHETTATALLWWSWLMASHPAAQQRACVEIDQVLDGGRSPCAADAAHLPWLTATLKEALRLYPPAAALMTRRVQRPFTLRGHTLPAGALVRITPWVIQRDARWFPEPEAFRPERFLDGTADWPRSAWLPFGTGPRVCVGQHFAMLEMTLIASLLLQGHRVQTLPGQAVPQPQLNVTLRPAQALQLRLVRRPRAC